MEDFKDYVKTLNKQKIYKADSMKVEEFNPEGTPWINSPLLDSTISIQ